MTRAEALAALAALLGPKGFIDAPEAVAPYAADWRGLETGAPVAVLRPAATEDVAACVRLCAGAGIPIVPQGGNTGLVGGTVARAEHGAVTLNLGRMDRIREVDADGFTLTAEAGCTLHQVRAAAETADRLFPLSLGAEGTCTIGGNLSTNAGGILTLRYGNARDLALGLEVVLPDGRVWHGLRRLRKDNTGYDLKHLFIGAEGTLGVITAASLKLYPRPRRVETALVAVPDPAASVALLGRLRDATGDALTAYELMPRFAVEGARTYLAVEFDPFAAPSPWYVLAELSGGGDLRGRAEAALAAALEAGQAADAVFAETEEHRRRFWRMREGLSELGRRVGGAVHHDVAVPVTRVPDLIAQAAAALAALVPGCRPYPFGHVGDGNIHLNVARPEDMTREDYLARAPEITRTVHDIVTALGGSVSAEHGIGGRKRDEMARVKSAVELDLMRAVKRALDPMDLLNPGKVLP
ncbi:MAG TPA: FAD-binding oxidoreductase [Azospirillaceae bacterium]|nr:FAD-binding oxidoreductase [Azospirillaceae bacterium]